MAKAGSKQDFNIRHRLVGAIVLLGFGVIVIPMILQGKGPGAVMKSESLTEEVQEWIVETEDATTYTSRVKPVAEQSKKTDLDTMSLNSGSGSNTDNGATPELVEVEDDTGVAVEDGQPADGELVPLIEQSGEQPEVVEQQSENVNQNNNQVAAVKLPEPAPITDLRPENVERGWVVQVGTFSKAENAQNLITKLNQYGFDSRYEVISTDSGQATRVWVGPYEKRVTAGRALEAVHDKAGVKGFIKSYP